MKQSMALVGKMTAGKKLLDPKDGDTAPEEK